MLTRLLSLLLSAPDLIAGHGSMAVPPPRGMHGRPIECFTKKGGKRYCNAGCPEENCLWYQVGCMVGCDDCSLEGKQMWPTPADVQCKRNGSLVPPGKTPFPIPRTVPAEARSWNLKLRSPAGDFTAYMPWASPGASPVADPCGVASGFGASAHTPSYVHAPKGYRVGELGSRVLEPLPTKTVVRAGGTLETGFGVKVNHGGGYSFRLCPAGSPLTEARQPTAAAALLCSSVPPSQNHTTIAALPRCPHRRFPRRSRRASRGARFGASAMSWNLPTSPSNSSPP